MREKQKGPEKLHKEEITPRITTDAEDCEKIRKVLGKFIKHFVLVTI